MYTAKKSYFALSSLSEFLRASAGCSNKQPVFLYAKIFSLLVLTLSALLSAIFELVYFVLMYYCVHGEKILFCIKLIIRIFASENRLLENSSRYFLTLPRAGEVEVLASGEGYLITFFKFLYIFSNSEVVT